MCLPKLVLFVQKLFQSTHLYTSEFRRLLCCDFFSYAKLSQKFHNVIFFFFLLISFFKPLKFHILSTVFPQNFGKCAKTCKTYDQLLIHQVLTAKDVFSFLMQRISGNAHNIAIAQILG